MNDIHTPEPALQTPEKTAHAISRRNRLVAGSGGPDDPMRGHFLDPATRLSALVPGKSKP